MTTLSKIEWTDTTWNPVTGCTPVSPGCDNCYAEPIANRFAGGPAFPRGFEVTLHPGRLDAPLHWRKPRRVFVNSMADLFHHDVPAEYVARVFAVMAATPQHTYQVLTKRHGRMRSLLNRWSPVTGAPPWTHIGPWPLPNVWLGVSVEDQQRADLRIPELLKTPAAVRFISAEPLLGPVRLDPAWLAPPAAVCPPPDRDRETSGHIAEILRAATRAHAAKTGAPEQQFLSWVIAGGESGPRARPLDEQWIRDLVRQCQAAAVPVFVKQLGTRWARAHGVAGDSKGGNPDHWSAELRVREFPAGAGG